MLKPHNSRTSFIAFPNISTISVSYTHLDVYKRQHNNTEEEESTYILYKKQTFPGPLLNR